MAAEVEFATQAGAIAHDFTKVSVQLVGEPVPAVI